MKVTGLAPWFGSKRNLAPRIVEALGKHSAYWEPFCGSMAVLFAKPECTVETVCDLHGDLTNLARVIQHAIEGPRLYRRLRRVLMNDAQHAESVERMQQPFKATADRAFDFFIYSWQSRNGVAGTGGFNHSFARRFTSKGGQGAKRFHSAVESIPQFRRRLRHVNVLNCDAFEIIERIEDVQGTAIYCDPPYLVKGAKYVHDFADDDHQRLAVALRRFKRTRVVVSYYDHPRLADLYPGWRVEKIEVTKAMVNQGMRDQSGTTKAIEVLLINESQGRLAL